MKKVSNCIAVGGPIAVGKSTLVGTLPFNPVHELDENDELQQILLKKMYEKNPIAPQIFQLDIMLQRFKKYENLANSKDLHVFDRTIFEDYIFAKNLLENDEYFWEYYKSIWENRVQKIIEEIGIPRVYIILKMNWENFSKRIYERGRRVELNNFEKNKEYFQNLLKSYNENLIEMLNKFEIDYFEIDTNLTNKIEVNKIALNYLKKLEIL